MNENSNMAQKNNKMGIGILIGIIISLVIGLGGLVIYNITTKEEKNTENKEINNSISNNQDELNENTDTTTNKFSYKFYDLELINEIKETDKIYAIDVKRDSNDLTTFDIFVRYQDEKKLKIASIKLKDNLEFESRTLDFENDKLFFIIRNEGTTFELNSIDFKNLSNGSYNYSDFNDVFIRDNLWKIGTPEKSKVYPSQIFVKGNDIFYTSFKSKELKKYNIQTKAENTVLNNFDDWGDYFIDKANNKIFYYKNYKLYLCNIDGTNIIEIENKYTGSNFWTHAFYKGSPLFEEMIYVDGGVGEPSDVNLYIYDYNHNEFNKIEDNIKVNYIVKYNSIETNHPVDTQDSSINSFYIHK